MSKNIIKADDKHVDTFDLGGAVWKIQIPGPETGNQFSLVESISPPGIGSPLHRHIRADQAIYVLEGELEILADSKSFFFAKGETCLIRRGSPHREINSSRSETRFITIHSPGFFSEFIRLAGIPVPVGGCRQRSRVHSWSSLAVSYAAESIDFKKPQFRFRDTSPRDPG